jgi:chromosome segregation ATPase
MSEQQRPSPQEVQKYIDGAMKRLDEKPDSLEPYERRLLTKIRKSSGAAQQSMKDVQDLKNQITQAEARLRSVELQAESYQGSVNAYIDEVVSLKFNVEEPLPEATAKPPETPPTNGKAPINRHEKRAAKAKGEKQEAHPASN